jgi:hypothetical protein
MRASSLLVVDERFISTRGEALTYIDAMTMLPLQPD